MIFEKGVVTIPLNVELKDCIANTVLTLAFKLYVTVRDSNNEVVF